MKLGAWLGLFAIALHALAPVLGSTLYGATSSTPSHTHDYASHQHHHGTSSAAAEHAPAAPELVCVGDCSWSTPNDRPAPLPSRAPVVVLPADSIAEWRVTLLEAPPVFHPGTHFPPRAPPVSS